MPIADILGAPHAYDLRSPASLGDLPENDLLENDLPEKKSSENALETIVFIHGWLLSRSYWQPLISDLCAGESPYQCLTYDMRGFGESLAVTHTPSLNQANVVEPQRRTIPLPPNKKWYPGESPYTNDSFSLAAYAQDLDALLDELNLDQVWLMGHSLGGSVALWAAYLFPERIKGVICLNAGGGIYIPKEFEKFRGAGQQMVKYRPQWLTKLPVLPRIFTRAMVHKTLALKWGRQRLQDFIGADRAAAEGALLASTTQDEVLQLPQLMGELSQPVHFITATQDSIMPPRYVNYLASYHRDFRESCPQGMVSEIEDCGHMAMVEQPEAVAKVVRAVLAQRSVSNAAA
ncbi:MAG: alpha/beta hydrolase [Phormidesmis sp.]